MHRVIPCKRSRGGAAHRFGLMHIPQRCLRYRPRWWRRLVHIRLCRKQIVSVRELILVSAMLITMQSPALDDLLLPPCCIHESRPIRLAPLHIQQFWFEVGVDLKYRPSHPSFIIIYLLIINLFKYRPSHPSFVVIYHLFIFLSIVLRIPHLLLFIIYLFF